VFGLLHILEPLARPVLAVVFDGVWQGALIAFAVWLISGVWLISDELAVRLIERQRPSDAELIFLHDLIERYEEAA
jgi:hypothetical protein